MGNWRSKPLLIGAGRHGKVYRVSETRVKKIIQYDEKTRDYENEVVFYQWINGLSPEEQRYFAVGYSHAKYTRGAIWRGGHGTRAFCEFVSEYKGAKIVFDHSVCLTDLRKSAAQILCAIRIMKNHGVVHCDIHRGNIVDMDGQIALIDYGCTDAAPGVDMANRNDMMIQFAAMLVNFADTIDTIRAAGTSYTAPTCEYIIEMCHVHCRPVYDYVARLCRAHGYSLGSRVCEWKLDYIAYSIMDIILRVYDFDLYCAMYKLEGLHRAFFPLVDIFYIFNNWTDIDSIITYFS